MSKILIVEDDKELNELVCSFFENNNYNVVSSFNGKEALEKLEKENFDLILSDIMMPVLDGFSFVEKVRSKDTDIPIIFMTARDDKFSKQLGYKIGVDDYIVKPFDIDELLLKVGAILRRTNIKNNKKIVIGNLTLDAIEHTAYLDDEELSLTVREFDLLFKLLSFPKQTFTRSQLMEEFWDMNTDSGEMTIYTHIHRLRERYENCKYFEIVTLRNLGYKAVIK